MSPGPRLAKATLRTPAAEPLVFSGGPHDPMELAILEAMSDSTSRTILNSIVTAGKSVEEITAESGIPVSTVYRRVHELSRQGLVIVEQTLFSESGRRYCTYRSTLRGAKIDVEFDGVKVVGLPNDSISDITRRHWRLAGDHPETR